jgi:hypothetical protein
MPNNSVSGDLRWSGCRSCFFTSDKSVQFIHFSSLDSFRYGCIWQTGSAGFDPQGYSAVVDTQLASYPTQIHAINVELQGLPAHFVTVTMNLWLGCIFASTVHTAIALGCGCCFPSSILTSRLVTARTCFHISILAHIYSHSLSTGNDCYFVHLCYNLFNN